MHFSRFLVDHGPTLFLQVLCFCALVCSVGGVTTVGFTTPAGGAPGTPTTLHENVTAQTELAIITCDPNTVGVTCTCNLQSTIPLNGPFSVWLLTGQTAYKVYFLGGHTLNFNRVPRYQVTVTCTDVPPAGVTAVTGTADLEVYILPNQRPVITGYPAVTATTLDAQAGQAVGSTVYTVVVTDPENDVIRYSMTQTPNSGYFTIGQYDGVIKTAVELQTVTVDTVVCTVDITDGQHVVQGFKVTVKLSNLNTRPVISNLPATVDVPEDSPAGYVILTLAFNDATPQTKPLQPVCSVSPTADSYKFTLDTRTQQLMLSTVSAGQTLLDYETTTTYTITCELDDGYLTSVGDVLTVNVQNVNEPPVFNKETYHCSLVESDAGISSCDLGLVVNDPEGQPIQTIALLAGGNSDRFRYDRPTDKLTFNVDYDVDGNNMPTTALITVYAVDASMLTSTAKISITILDANDNACDFGLQQAAAQFTVNQGTSLTTLGSFAATDADLTAPNNQISFEVVSGFPVSSLNYLTVFRNGEIKYIGLIPESEHGKSFSLTVRCKDGGSPSLSSTATVQLSYLTTTTSTTTTTATSTTTTSEPSVWDFAGFQAVFGVLMALLGLTALAGLLWCLCCRGGGLCLPTNDGLGNASGNGCFDCCGPRYERQPRHVKQADDGDDFFRSGRSRVSPDYKDHAWRSGDNYEIGLGYDGRPASKSDIFLTGPHRPRALPAPSAMGY